LFKNYSEIFYISEYLFEKFFCETTAYGIHAINILLVDFLTGETFLSTFFIKLFLSSLIASINTRVKNCLIFCLSITICSITSDKLLLKLRSIHGFVEFIITGLLCINKFFHDIIFSRLKFIDTTLEDLKKWSFICTIGKGLQFWITLSIISTFNNFCKYR